MRDIWPARPGGLQKRGRTGYRGQRCMM